MAKSKVTRTRPVSIRLTAQMASDLEQRAAGKPKTAVMEQALERYLHADDSLFAHQKVLELREAAYGKVAPTRSSEVEILARDVLLPKLKEGAEKNEAVRQACYDALVSIWRHPARFAINHQHQTIEIILFGYPARPGHPGGGYMQELQEHISRTVLVHEQAATNQAGDQSYFDVAVRPELMFRPRVFAFGFYLSQERRAHFGVLPWGWHRRFGLLARRSLVGKIAARLQTSSVEELMRRVAGEDGFAVIFLEELWKQISASPDARVHSVDGFISEELAAELIFSRGGSRGEEVFSRRCRKFIPRDVANIAGEGAALLESSDSSVVLFDNIYAGGVPSGGDVVHLDVPHNLKIPVGVGFTLTALPRLIEHGVINRMGRALYDFFHDRPEQAEAIKGELASQGVEFDASLIARYGRLGPSVTESPSL